MSNLPIPYITKINNIHKLILKILHPTRRVAQSAELILKIPP